MRECARRYRIHRTTVDRKKRFLAQMAKKWLHDFRDQRLFQDIQFDDMETFEHTTCNPLSICIVVENPTRLIIGFKVSKMAARGPLAPRALKKYGPRPDHRKRGRITLFKELQSRILPTARIASDLNPHYPPDVQRFFPDAEYVTTRGRRGCVVGQGELKTGGFDPLFSLNHTAAMIRANVNRLFRRTWCTTKKIQGLEDHLSLYAKAHNERILARMIK